MLKYCSLLFEETDNDGQAETMLSKGVSFIDEHIAMRKLMFSRLRCVIEYDHYSFLSDESLI